MSEFPLYDRLLIGLPVGPLTRIRKKTFVSSVSKLDTNGHELVYALIRMHQIQHEDDRADLPWKGSVKSTGIEFDLNDMPNILQQILFKFAKTHMTVMQNEPVRI
jgi:hypothetical protein